ncbi:MAG: hypothetical protein HC906_14515 [Bacteroidales bacterium]|nr:hypothetical protein [Bacteroidales bacterium]
MKFDDAKKLSIQQILEYIQLIARENTLKIKNNNEKAEKLNLSGVDVKLTDDLIKKYYAQNNQLIRQNNEFLELHSRLLNFLKSIDQWPSIQLLQNSEKVDIQPVTHMNQWVLKIILKKRLRTIFLLMNITPISKTKYSGKN